MELQDTIECESSWNTSEEEPRTSATAHAPVGRGRKLLIDPRASDQAMSRAMKSQLMSMLTLKPSNRERSLGGHVLRNEASDRWPVAPWPRWNVAPDSRKRG
jgi:hypothetical protein